MAQYIDKDAVVAEIERKISVYHKDIKDAYKAGFELGLKTRKEN